jgi:predicted DCC family thiol-disulfide oxidoreductase YuxK
MAEPESKSIVLFDGVCNVCNDAVNFIIDRDPRKRFQFASLQSEVGQRLRQEYSLGTDLETMALIEGRRAYVRSSAALQVVRRLAGLWPLLYVAILVPTFIRDAAYRYFAHHRYRWFGKREACRVPTPEIRARFLDST